MMPVFEIFGLRLSSYWTMFAIGMLVIVALSAWRAQRYQFALWKALVLAVGICVFGVAGVLLLGFVQSGFRTWNTSFMGALIFTPLFVALLGALLRIRPTEAVAFSAVSICAMSVCMKIGCYLAGCCGGIAINGAEIPVQLIESGLSLVILFVLILSELKINHLAVLFPAYMILYAFVRFPVEYLRDTDKNILGMSVGQVTALVVFFIGIGFVFILAFQKKKELSEAQR